MLVGDRASTSNARRIGCPFCESGSLVIFGPGLARCDSCGLPLLGSTLEALRDIVSLPDALGSHPCECGHPKMRRLPDGSRGSRPAGPKSCPSPRSRRRNGPEYRGGSTPAGTTMSREREKEFLG
jgi:hypothetical protein